MGTHGFAWVQWGVFARGDRKTRGKEATIGDQDMFCRCGHGQQKQYVVGRDGRGGQRGYRGGNVCILRGFQRVYINLTEVVLHIAVKSLQKKSKTSKRT